MATQPGFAHTVQTQLLVVGSNLSLCVPALQVGMSLE